MLSSGEGLAHSLDFLQMESGGVTVPGCPTIFETQHLKMKLKNSSSSHHSFPISSQKYPSCPLQLKPFQSLRPPYTPYTEEARTSVVLTSIEERALAHQQRTEAPEGSRVERGISPGRLLPAKASQQLCNLVSGFRVPDSHWHFSPPPQSPSFPSLWLLICFELGGPVMESNRCPELEDTYLQGDPASSSSHGQSRQARAAAGVTALPPSPA